MSLCRKEIEDNGWVFINKIHARELFKKEDYGLQVCDYKHYNKPDKTSIIICQYDYLTTSLFQGLIQTKDQLDLIEELIGTI